MARSKQRPVRQTNLLQALAEFRFHLRSFLQFSEQIAKKQRLHPRQHQLLLQIAGIAEGHSATINYLAERLGLRQNSVVELANRSVAEGLVRRNEDPCDHRRVILSVTPKGMRVLDALSASHARELDEYGPRLIRTLERIKIARSKKEHIPVIGRPQTARKPVGTRSRSKG
jgi:DNA-binding MarR family transcriptional regulator